MPVGVPQIIVFILPKCWENIVGKCKYISNDKYGWHPKETFMVFHEKLTSMVLLSCGIFLKWIDLVSYLVKVTNTANGSTAIELSKVEFKTKHRAFKMKNCLKDLVSLKLCKMI